MKKSIVLLCCGVVIISIAGCATLVSPTNYQVTFTTNAPDASVVIRNPSSGVVFSSGKAPLMVTLKPSKSFLDRAVYQCEVIDANAKKQTRVIEADFNNWVIGNFIFGGIIGMCIDGWSGAAYKLDEAYYIHFSEYENVIPQQTQKEKTTEKTEEKAKPETKTEEKKEVKEEKAVK